VIRPKLLSVVLLALAALGAPTATQAADFDFVPGGATVSALKRDGTVETQAGSHPYSYIVHFELKTDAKGDTEGGIMRDAQVDLPPGLFGNPNAIPSCPQQDFAGAKPSCPPNTQVGILRAILPGVGEIKGAVYNLTPPRGYPAQFGFSSGSSGLISLQYSSVRSEDGYGITVSAPNLPVGVSSVTETIWGMPADPGHDAQRGFEAAEDNGGPIASDAPLIPFLTLPSSCEGTPEATIKADSRLTPGIFAEAQAPALDAGGNPAPMSGCESVPFSPTIGAELTSRLTAAPSGLDFTAALPNQGLLDPKGIAESQPRKAVVTLPRGVTINPALAEGIAVCSPAQYAAEKIDSGVGAGCPQASKLGSVVVHSPLIDEAAEGSLYLATPFDNPFGTFSALYMVVRAPGVGLIVKQAGKVEFDPATGQITSTFDNLPPLPYSSFSLHFREGARAPLATPSTCGTYTTTATLTPFSAQSEADTVTATSSLEIDAACPPAGVPPFHPGLLAGSLSAGAGQYSPFYVGLTRTDAEQEFTNFSIKLPPGLVGKLAGIPFCPDAAIAAARARTGNHGGQEEIDSPSCPAASEIGHTLVGGGVGSALAYAPGKLYLAGPYHGSALSIAAITAARVGPFDLGTVVVRYALKVNPETAEVFIDATGSDPIPHIIAGIPIHLRDVNVYTDRPDFTLNPTSCKRTSTASTVLGSGLDFVSQADDQPVTVTSPFQAVNCARLGFKPKLAISLKGGTERNDNPALKAVVTYPKGAYANIADAQVTLPHSEFLDNSHIKTICTRVQFKEGTVPGEKCPAASVYGRARARTPLLDEPLSGPVYLRSSSHELPDLVVALHSGKIDIDLVGRIDSVDERIRNTFEALPDAPISSFVLEMQGGKKGLLVNSADLCARPHRAKASFTGQNGKQHRFNPVVKASCGAGAKKK